MSCIQSPLPTTPTAVHCTPIPAPWPSPPPGAVPDPLDVPTPLPLTCPAIHTSARPSKQPPTICLPRPPPTRQAATHPLPGHPRHHPILSAVLVQPPPGIRLPTRPLAHPPTSIQNPLIHTPPVYRQAPTHSPPLDAPIHSPHTEQPLRPGPVSSWGTDLERTRHPPQKSSCGAAQDTLGHRGRFPQPFCPQLKDGLVLGERGYRASQDRGSMLTAHCMLGTVLAWRPSSELTTPEGPRAAGGRAGRWEGLGGG